MTPEERMEYHEQWLRSMESNQAQFAENMGHLTEKLNLFAENQKSTQQELASFRELFREHVVTVAMNQASLAGTLAKLTEEHLRLMEDNGKLAQGQVKLTEAQAKLTEEQVKLTEGQVKLTEELRDLRDVVDRYIRFRGNGNPPAN